MFAILINYHDFGVHHCVALLHSAPLAAQEQQAQAQRQREERRRKLQKAQEEAELLEQARRNAARAQQELTEMAAYERQYGKVGGGCREGCNLKPGFLL